MKKVILIFVFGSVLLSCDSKDEQFCKCLKAGEELNEYSNAILNGEATLEKADKLRSLKDAKKEACKNYQTMTGEEMLKRKAECK